MVLGASGKSFMPMRGFPTLGLNVVDGEPLMLTSGRWYYEVTMGHGHPSSSTTRFGWRDEQRTSWVVDGFPKRWQSMMVRTRKRPTQLGTKFI